MSLWPVWLWRRRSCFGALWVEFFFFFLNMNEFLYIISYYYYYYYYYHCHPYFSFFSLSNCFRMQFEEKICGQALTNLVWIRISTLDSIKVLGALDLLGVKTQGFYLFFLCCFAVFLVFFFFFFFFLTVFFVVFSFCCCGF